MLDQLWFAPELAALFATIYTPIIAPRPSIIDRAFLELKRYTKDQDT